ncbi:MAG TPA: hypothetical protein VEY09_16240 [Pyrinomonadaceae bacterium]|nr:hypothetical protein [Pyrinomonadaceae bacterium]
MSLPGSPTNDEKVTAQLSFLANNVSGLLGPDLESELYESILSYFDNHQSQLGKWEIAWGPAVVQLITDSYAINAIYVAHSLDRPSWYVVAVAGTNPPSPFDWLVEDLLVREQVPWIYALFSAPGAKISLGTAVGLGILQNAKPSGSRPNAGRSLQDFLSGLPSLEIDLSVTGHSLGGALAPTLALWLKDIRLLWNPAGNVRISTMPLAGPSAGNSAFSLYSDKTLPTKRFVNSLDVVPHAWNESTLGQLKNIYAPSIPENSDVDALIGRAMQAASGGDYLSVQPNSPPITGEINQGKINPQAPPFINYVIQMGYQHVEAYIKYFGLSDMAFKPLVELYSNPHTLITPALRLVARRADMSLSEPDQASMPSGPRTIPIAGRPVILPTNPDDPRMAEIVEMVKTELKKFAAPE